GLGGTALSFPACVVFGFFVRSTFASAFSVLASGLSCGFGFSSGPLPSFAFGSLPSLAPLSFAGSASLDFSLALSFSALRASLWARLCFARAWSRSLVRSARSAFCFAAFRWLRALAFSLATGPSGLRFQPPPWPLPSRPAAPLPPPDPEPPPEPFCAPPGLLEPPPCPFGPRPPERLPEAVSGPFLGLLLGLLAAPLERREAGTLEPPPPPPDLPPPPDPGPDPPPLRPPPAFWLRPYSG